MSNYLGRYRILRTLGEGGMGRVYLAEAAGPGGFVRRVVVKVVQKIGDASLHQALVDEAKIAAALVHQNIVPVLDFDEAGGERMVILEHVDGLDLAQLVDRGGPLPTPLALYVAAEAAAALDYAHRKRDAAGKTLGLVHRDVSSANLMVSWEGEVKLTDFGVAGLLRSDDSSVGGNLSYMAPEQARGATVDGRADLFALAVVLWELLAGHPPFPADSTLESARRRKLPLLPSAPPQVAAILARAGAISPDDRYPTAAALREALLGLPGGLPDPGRSLARHISQFKRRQEGGQLDPSALKRAALGAGRPMTQVAPRSRGPNRRLMVAVIGGAALVGSLGGIYLGFRTSQKLPESVAAPMALPPPPAEPPKMGTISINAVPWAHIYIDGKSAGQTPRVGVPLRAGPHTIRLVTGGGDERTRSLTVQPGRESRLTVDFARP